MTASLNKAQSSCVDAEDTQYLKGNFISWAIGAIAICNYIPRSQPPLILL